MARLRSHRTALVLYAVLLVLPAVAFGSLLWYQLDTERRFQLANAPEATGDAAGRLEDAIRGEFRRVLAQEDLRDVFEYQRDRWLQGANDEDVYVDTDLESQPLPTGVLGWFRFDVNEGSGVNVDAFTGVGADRVAGDPLPAVRMDRRGAIANLVRDIVFPRVFVRQTDLGKIDPYELRVLLDLEQTQSAIPSSTNLFARTQIPVVEMAMNLHEDRVPAKRGGCCLRCLRRAVHQLGNQTDVTVYLTPMRLYMVRDTSGEMRLLAYRHYFVPPMRRAFRSNNSFPEHLDAMLDDQYWVQGVVLDADYFFDLLPKEKAEQVLPAGYEAHTQHSIGLIEDEDWETAPLDFLDGVQVACPEGADRTKARLVVATNVARMEEAFRRQSLVFFGVAGAMIVSLALGLQLLLGSLKQSQEQAQRTENFVAAVTHELRTPIAAVRMYGEMLRDGWVSSQERQDEYLRRIVKETLRLGSLVDRVIDKRRLNSAPPKPEPGDLEEELQTQRRDLGLEDEADVHFQLRGGLPEVWMTSIGVHAVLQNLVENALKYAPVDPAQAGSEPIIVRTDVVQGQVVLEVLDRGPGIPPQEKKRIFDAFYRPGSEQTRQTQGTGLGLHLVEQYARLMKASVTVEDRPGGGIVFRVTFRTLKRS